MNTALLFLAGLSLIVLQKNRQLLVHYLLGAFCALPLIIIDPLVRAGFFEQLSTKSLVEHFATQALLTLMLGGLAATLYEWVVAPKFRLRQAETRQYLGIFLIGFSLMLVLFLFSSLSLASCVGLGLLINIIILVSWRSDLVWDATFSALGTALLYAMVFSWVVNEPGQIDGLWFNSAGLSGLTVAGLPIEELLVVACFGAFFGPVYIAAKSYYRR